MTDTKRDSFSAAVDDAMATPARDLLNGPDFDWIRSVATRRLLVVGACAFGLAAAVTFALAAHWRDPWLLGLFALLPPLAVFLAGSVSGSVRGLVGLPASELDEWQRVRRDAMHRRCWLPALALFGTAVLVAVSGVPDWVRIAVLTGGLFAAFALPSAALAWSYPDEPGVHD